MKDFLITLDTGTTNTRVRLLDKERKLLASAAADVGVRMTAIDGNNEKLKQAIRECLEQVLSEAGIREEEVERILASGMITSNLGLCEIPHVPVKAGVGELAEHARTLTIPEITRIPFTFIPGVKNSADPVTKENFEAMDIMRGEEVESIGLLSQYPKGKPYLIVLPGSHMKFVSTDEQGKITGCLTTISGELLSAITHDTILADACGRSFVSREGYDRDMMRLGYRTAKKAGIGRACFSGRILNQFAEKDKEKIASYLLGVCLQPDMEAILKSSALKVGKDTEVILAGKEPLKSAIADILQEEGCFSNVHGYEREDELPLSSRGVLEVYDKIKTEGEKYENCSNT